jgi:hypothetical protein
MERCACVQQGGHAGCSQEVLRCVFPASHDLEASSTRGDAALVTRGFTIAKSAQNQRIFFSVVSTMASVDSLANAKRTADWLTAMTKHQEERLEEDCPASAHIFEQLGSPFPSSQP